MGAFIFADSKAFNMFDLKKENQVLIFVKRNPLLITLAVIIVCGFLILEAHAAGLGGLSNSLKRKIKDLADAFSMVTGAAAGIGVLWLVFTFIKGDPNYRYAGSLIVGGSLLACAPYVS